MSVLRVWKPAPGVLEILGALPDGIRTLAEWCFQDGDWRTWQNLLDVYPRYKPLLVRAADLQGGARAE